MTKAIPSLFEMRYLNKPIELYKKVLDMVASDRFSFSELALVYKRNVNDKTNIP